MSYQPSNRLTGKAVIDKLEWLDAHRLPLSVRLNRREDLVMETIVQEVLDKRKLIRVAQFNTEDVDRSLRRDDELDISFFADHLEHRFVCLYRKTPNLRSHLLCFPKYIDVNQRREFYRQEPVEPAKIDVRLLIKDLPEPVPADLVNLSLGGMRAVIQPHDQVIGAGKSVDVRIFLHAIEEKFAFEASIRYTSVTDEGAQELGIQFLEVDKAEEHRLSRIINEWQREIRRREKEKNL